MRFTLPPHIGWPLLVVLLLSISVSASIYTFVAAGSEGGAQVVEDYYERGLRWNEEQAERTAAERRGWTMDVDVEPRRGDGLRRVIISITDSMGIALADRTGSVRLLRPHLAGAITEIPLLRDAEHPARFVQLLPMDSPGLWDLEVRIRDDASTVVMRTRVDVD